MRTLAFAAAAACVASTTALVLSACSADDNASPSSPFAGTGGGADATVDGAPAGDSGPVGVPLCGAYGGYSFVQKLTSALGKRLQADCRIDFYFSAIDPKTAHVFECLTQQMGTFFQCPGVTYAKDSKGNPCVSMGEAHKDLHLRSADFQAFLDDVIATMRAEGMKDSDIQSILPTFIGIESSVVTQQGSGDQTCTCAGQTYDGGSCAAGDDGGDDGGDAGTDATDSGGASDTGSTQDTGAPDAGADATDAASE